MSSTAMAVPAQESKLWACLKDAYGWAEDKVWENFAKLGAKLIVTAMGFHGEVAQKVTPSIAGALMNLITTISRGGNSTQIGGVVARAGLDIGKSIANALYEEGWKGVAGKLFLPYRIATIIYDWLAPVIPCLFPDPKVPDTEPAVNASSPLVIDLNGDGVGSYKLKNGVYFDLDNNGFKEKTAWAHYQDGLLALDLNGNGTIDNGAELFGNHTKLKDGTLATNGFDALAQYDDNGDGVINNKDRVWKNLLVWQDKVNDGAECKNSTIYAVNDTIFAFQAA